MSFIPTHECRGIAWNVIKFLSIRSWFFLHDMVIHFVLCSWFWYNVNTKHSLTRCVWGVDTIKRSMLPFRPHRQLYNTVNAWGFYHVKVTFAWWYGYIFRTLLLTHPSNVLTHNIVFLDVRGRPYNHIIDVIYSAWQISMHYRNDMDIYFDVCS